MEISTGAHESPKDTRDIKDPHLALGFPYPISSQTDINMCYVEYQRKVGACTASLKTYIEWLYYKKTGTYVRLSMAFLYIVTKLYIDNNRNEGSSLRSVLKASFKYGVCSEETFPSDFTLTHEQFLSQIIPQKAWTEALNYTIGGYINIPIEKSLMCAALDKYGMLYVRYSVDKNWWTPSWLAKDILPLKSPSDSPTGHAVLLTGYNLAGEKGRTNGRNTWSVSWADGGNFYTHYEDYAPTEAWVVTLESQMHLSDNGIIIEDSIWRKLLEVMRNIGILK